MKTAHLSGLENKEIKVVDDEKPSFPHDIFQPYCRVALTGASGCGKTNAFINLFEKMYPQLDKVYVVSPTISNCVKQRMAFVDREKVMVFDEPTEELIRDIQKDAQRIHEQYNRSIKVRKAWDKWRKNKWDETKLTGTEMGLLDSIMWDIDNIAWKHSRRPCLCLFADDLMGTKVLRGKALEALTIKSRHYNLCLFLTTQTFKGISPNIRRNMSGYMVFRTIDHNLLKDIFTETMGMWKSFDDFMEKYEYATGQNKHEFLYLDMNAKENGIRKNFNEVILDEKGENGDMA